MSSMTPDQTAVPEQAGERVPPQDLEAERAVLGGMLQSATAIGDAVEAMQERDFYRPTHQAIHAAIMRLYTKGEPADPLTVTAELTKAGEIARVGGPGYLHGLVPSVPTVAHTAYYAEIVHETAVLRRLTEAGIRIAQLGHSGGEVDDVQAAAEAELLDALKGRGESAGYAYVREDVPSFWDRLDARAKGETLQGVPTGFTDLDGLTNGFRAGQLIIVGARPATGKSTLALDWGRAAARAGKTAVFYSLEMGREEITDRLYSAECRVPLHHIQSGTVSETDMDKMASDTARIEAMPLIIDDTPSLTLTEIRTRCRRLAQAGDLDEILVDYTQLLTLGGTRRPESRQQEVSEISRGLKLLAKELQVPVVALCQLNRGPEQRVDKRPVVSDLRESGSLEQDADMVILLHREDVYEKESSRAGEADLIVGKHRNGPTGTITLAFQGHYSRFVDMAAH